VLAILVFSVAVIHAEHLSHRAVSWVRTESARGGA
jgi:hypothetical protein